MKKRRTRSFRRRCRTTFFVIENSQVRGCASPRKDDMRLWAIMKTSCTTSSASSVGPQSRDAQRATSSAWSRKSASTDEASRARDARDAPGEAPGVDPEAALEDAAREEASVLSFVTPLTPSWWRLALWMFQRKRQRSPTPAKNSVPGSSWVAPVPSTVKNRPMGCHAALTFRMGSSTARPTPKVS